MELIFHINGKQIILLNIIIWGDVMEQLLAAFLFFSIALAGFWGALKFSNFKGESHEECTDEDSCALKKLGIKNLKCDH